MTVCIPPAITHQPTGQQVNANASATLSVTATGTSLHYQWYRGTAGTTTNPVGTDSATYTFTATSSQTYWVRVSGGCGSVDSTAVAVDLRPVIVTQPQSGSVGTNQTMTLSVTATGSALHYQWYRGSDSSTAAGPGCKLITVNVSSGDAGNVTYFWYKGASGDTTHPLGGGPNYLTACPTASTQYWCRVTFNDGTCSTDTTAVTVTP